MCLRPSAMTEVFPSDSLLIQASILSVCFLKCFVSMCQVSCTSAALVCVFSARWGLPLCSTTSCLAGSCSAPCTFLIQRLWVVFWPASPETWMRVRVDLSCLSTLPVRELSVREVTLVENMYRQDTVVLHGLFLLQISSRGKKIECLFYTRRQCGLSRALFHLLIHTTLHFTVVT